MIACIDIDDTLTAWPEVIAPLTKALRAGGWHVILLTGCATQDPNYVYADLVEGRKRQVAPLGPEYDEIHVCVGRNSDEVAALKGQFLACVGASLFIDDSQNYVEQARKRSPGTLTLQTPRRVR